MSRCSLVFLLAALALLALSCSDLEQPTPLAPAGDAGGYSVDTEGLAWAFVDQAGWEPAVERNQAKTIPSDGGECLLWNFNREVIAGNIVHYSAVVRTGPGPYDQIGIHRVVKESRPFRPIHTQKALFLLHGDLKDFEGMWLPGQFSPNLPDDFGLAAYLAGQRIDVWGITQAWNFVPREETDLSFFAGWGMQKEMDHLSIGLSIARLSRWIGGDGLDKMLLLGYSGGSMIGYGLLNEEAQRPEPLRQVRGFISADCGVRAAGQDFIDISLQYVAYYEAQIAGGQHYDALITHDIGVLAQSDPDGASPFAEGFTNMQFALYVGGGMIQYPLPLHYHAPVMDGDLPSSLQFVTAAQWLDFIVTTAAYEPALMEMEYNQLWAMLDSPYVSHLGEITVPVFDVSAGGGNGPYTIATLDYLGSSDITQLMVSMEPDPALDYGHIDLFTGNNARELVWEPIRDWVAAHSTPGRAPIEPLVAADD